MRENRPYGLEGGESGSTGLPYPYRAENAHRLLRNRNHPLPSGGHRSACAVPPLWRRSLCERGCLVRINLRECGKIAR